MSEPWNTSAILIGGLSLIVGGALGCSGALLGAYLYLWLWG